MRLFWAALAIVVLFALDRAYMGGQNAEHLWSLVQWIGTSIKYWAQDLLQPLRR
jgi:hypothetical protein